MGALMLAVFTVSVGFGVVLPLLPHLIERLLGTGVEAADVSRHAGFLNGVNTRAIFLLAHVWGRLCDWVDRQPNVRGQRLLVSCLPHLCVCVRHNLTRALQIGCPSCMTENYRNLQSSRRD
jgi:hypothetical protein